MGSRSANLRTKIIALLVSLAALWAFAAWVTVRDAVNLFGLQALNARIVEPSDPLLLQLQNERRLSLAYLGQSDPDQLQALVEQQRRTDDTASAWWRSAQDWRTGLAAGDQLEHRIAELRTTIDQLGGVRDEVGRKTIDRTATQAAYDEAIEAIFDTFDALGGPDDEEIARDTAALIDLNRARELLSQQDALLTGALAANRMTVAEQAAFARLVGAQWYLAERTAQALAPNDRDRYRQLISGDAVQQLRGLQDRILAAKGSDVRLPVSQADWQGAAQQTMEALRGVIRAGLDEVADRAIPMAVGVIARLMLAAGLGLVAVIASIMIAVSTARVLLRQLERLRDAALRLADEQLPGVVERLGHGEEVDVAREAPPLQFGDDEIGQLGKAFNAVQETAIRTAVEQAELRRNVREVFLSLARRTQALVHRQLTLLDAMERREHDADELEDLFRVDHLATRMRRNAENLIVLSGSTPGRSWRRNVPMVDVVRGAVAEVEDYTRVDVRSPGPVSLTGRAVADVIHLLAELIENGLSFSPPHTTVEVRGQRVANGFAIEIEDRGLGMSEEELAAANHRIVDRSELNLADAARLGLYVVSRLTERHGVKVQLKESPYGGTTAVVLIPSDLVTEDGPDADTSGRLPAGAGSPGVEAVPVAPDATAGAETEPADPVGTATTPETGEAAGPASAPAEVAPTEAPRATPSGLPARTRKRPSVTAEPADATTTTPPAVAADSEPVAEEATLARTGAGLPVRVRQASIVPELLAEPSIVDDCSGEEAIRPPEQVRRMMSSYQSGVRRGRTDAARLLGSTRGAGGEPDTGDEQAT